MPKIRNFHEALERDIRRLTVEVKEKRVSPEMEELPEKEIVRKSLEIFSPPAPAASAASAASAAEIEAELLPSYLQGEDVDKRIKLEVEKLINLAFQESIEKAIKEAKNKPPFIEDAFHDALVDKLLPELKKRGAI